MQKEKLLMTPGPTIVPPAVLMAESEPMIHHRTSTYSKIFKKFNENLKKVFQTQNLVITFPSAGTGGLEAAVVNFFSPGDKVLCVSIGVFGDRVATIAQAFGLEVEKLVIEWGEAVDPKIIEEKIENQDYKGVFVTHNETSTGVSNDIKSIGEILKDQEALLIVDAVSSLGGLDLRTDDWGVDVVVAASQKALMAPPGLSFLSISGKAWEAAKRSTCPKFYWDVLKARAAMEKPSPQNPYTPAISLIRAVNKAIEMILEEGLEKVFSRHAAFAKATQAAVEALGLKLFASPSGRSNVITSIEMPRGIDGDKVKKTMAEEYGVIVAGGQQDLKGKMLRIGHMGYVSKGDIIQTIAALEKALKMAGYPIEIGSGVKKALETLG